jgi:hypothetical protein
MSVTVNVDRKQGGTMGTVIARVIDPGNAVAEVVFYTQVQGSAETGPYPPDIVRREPGHLYQGTYHGVYEMDVVLDPLYTTSVRAVALLDGGTSVPGAAQSFGVRTAGSGNAVHVQDADTAATIVETLTFQGSVVQVQNRVATLDLDSRYVRVAQTQPYVPLGGGNMTGRLVVSMNTSNPTWNTGHAEFLTWDGSPAALGFHRSGYTAVTLRHAAAGTLELLDNTGTWAQYRGGSFRAEGGRFFGTGGAVLHMDNDAASFLSAFGGALQGRFQSLLLSDSYADAAQVPPLGLWAKGGVIAGSLEVGRTPYSGTLRNMSGPLHLQYGAGPVAIGNPASLVAKLNVEGSVHLQNGTVHTTGQTGWVNETYSGGWYMKDATWVRSYNNKSLWMGSGNIGGTGRLTLGLGTTVSLDYRAQFGGSVLIASGSLLVNGGNVNMNLGQASSAGSGGEVGRICFGDQPSMYYIGKSAAGASLNGSFAQLQVVYQTGIQIGAQAYFGGVRFYSSEHLLDDGGAAGGGIPRQKVFSVAEGDNNVRVTNNLRVGGDILDSFDNVVRAVIVAASPPATARPGTIWLQLS